MLIYKLGKVVHHNSEYILFESHSSGYNIKVNNAESYAIDSTLKLYVYEHKNEYSNSLYGFKSFKERIFFEDLMKINGIGPRTAMSLLKNGWEELAHLLVTSNVEALSAYPYVGKKAANQIIFELQSKWSRLMESDKFKVDATKIIEKNSKLEDLEKTLKVLGYKSKQIKFAIDHNVEDYNLETMVEQAIINISEAPQFKN
ncbi:Holliday junction DNA helicase subunit RuvA [Mycoplasma testudineum]|uniref:Holliday junction branch migration complex subunit RuvA n=1 Tax=Mycoplasma testudineum TaxID=244584 RepID=A0A4R6IE29_9MOLU|nr:Holliday junction branch migration protein RuvA [Mycoplasma testudineum]OYD26717.1 Holliday junction branch migration protein RuvA [Mycoplasma testudineum]TDO19848.1 Holliday junction DNA helicase subunit RuvA [Mycoplasma testudineum]